MIMHKKQIFIGSLIILIIVSLCIVFCIKNNNSETYHKINVLVENGTLKGDKFSYTIENDIKVCNIEGEQLNICYYAQNSNDIYAVVSETIEEYDLELIYEKDCIKIRVSDDELQYWCRVDHSMNPKDINEEVYYNKIINCISEQEIYDINEQFNEYTAFILKEYGGK